MFKNILSCCTIIFLVSAACEPVDTTPAAPSKPDIAGTFTGMIKPIPDVTDTTHTRYYIKDTFYMNLVLHSDSTFEYWTADTAGIQTFRNTGTWSFRNADTLTLYPSSCTNLGVPVADSLRTACQSPLDIVYVNEQRLQLFAVKWTPVLEMTGIDISAVMVNPLVRAFINVLSYDLNKISE